MEDLIKALQIFLKYGNPDYPTYCLYDELWVDIDPKKSFRRRFRNVKITRILP